MNGQFHKEKGTKNSLCYKLNLFLVFILTFIYIFRGVIIRLGMSNFPYLITIVGIIINLVFVFKKNIDKRLGLFWLFLYIGLIQLLISIMLMGVLPALLGFTAFYFNFVFWLLLFNNLDSYERKKMFSFIININIIFALISSVLGLFQYYFDPSIFGFATNEIYGNTELMNSGRFVRRATALIGSPQNYSLYLGIFTAISAYELKKSKFKVILIGILVFGGIVSGSRAYIATIIGIFLINLIYNFLKGASFKNVLIASISSVLGFLTMIIISIGKLSFENRTFTRIFNFMQSQSLLTQVEKIKVINGSNIFTGMGFGYNERLVAETLKTSSSFISVESYLLSLYLQGGLILIIIFLFMFFKTLIHSFKNKDIYKASILAVIFINLFFTPSFTGLAMSFIIWPLLMFFYLENKQTKNKLNRS